MPMYGRGYAEGMKRAAESRQRCRERNEREKAKDHAYVDLELLVPHHTETGWQDFPIEEKRGNNWRLLVANAMKAIHDEKIISAVLKIKFKVSEWIPKESKRRNLTSEREEPVGQGTTYREVIHSIENSREYSRVSDFF